MSEFEPYCMARVRELKTDNLQCIFPDKCKGRLIATLEMIKDKFSKTGRRICQIHAVYLESTDFGGFQKAGVRWYFGRDIYWV